MEWETSKENVQPLRKGRQVEVLNAALQLKEDCKDESKILDSQRRSMIEAIDNYEGDDPLRPWLNCIQWVKAAYPSGGYQSELLPVVEACTRTFQDDERYKSDVRYLRVWVAYADLCKEPQEIYQFLEARSIGQDHALFYEAYATYKEFCRSYSKANEIYELGLRRGAQPSTRLQSMYQSFLKRMVQRNERKLQEEQEDVFESGKLRHFGEIKSSKTRVPVTNPSFVQDQLKRKVQQPQVQRPGMEIFVDDEFHSGTRPSPASQLSGMRAPASAAWKNLGTQKEVKKENEQQPARWTETKLPRVGKVPKHVEAHPPIEVFVDDECEESHGGIQAKVKSESTTLRQRVDGACDVRRDQEALQKNPLLHFSGCEKPSTASLLREPRATARDQDESESGDGHSGSLSGASHLVGHDIYMVLESSFEEARLSTWKMPRQAVNHNPASSQLSSSEKAMLIEKSLNMFQSKTGRQHDREEQPPPSNLSDNEPPTTSTVSRASSFSSLDEPPAFACTMPAAQFSMNGEETVAIKKYAEELITFGADPNATRTDTGGHHGLIDQTINTKECLSDILSMFNRPLACEKPQRKPRATSTTASRPSNPNAAFEIFVDDSDDGLGVPLPPKNNKTKPAFEIFNDEENDPRQIPSGKKGFDVFVDDEPGARPGNKKSAPAPKKKPFQILQDEKPNPKPSKGSFDVLVDDDVDPPTVRPPPARRPAFEVFADGDGEGHTERRQMRPPPARRPAFEVFADDVADLKQPPKSFEDSQEFSKPFRGASASGGAKGGFQVYADDEELMPAPKKVERRIPNSAKPERKAQSGGFMVFVDEDMGGNQPIRKPSMRR